MKRISVAGVPEHFNTPWLYGINEKLFEAEDIALTFIPAPKGTGAMCQDLSSAKVDLAVVLTEGIVKHCIVENDCLIIAPFVDTPLNWGVFCSNQSGISKLADCLHKRFGISRFGSGSHLMAMLLAKEHCQWRPTREDFFVAGGIADLINAINTGCADVFLWEIFTTEPFMEEGNLKCVATYQTPWPCFQIAATKTLIESEPALVQRVIKIIQGINVQFNQDKNLAKTEIHKYFSLSPSRIDAWLKTVSWSTKMEPPVRATTLSNQALLSLGEVDRVVPSEELIAIEVAKSR